MIVGVGMFSELLAELRERAGLSQYALARKAGLTRQALSRLELGEREPTWHTVQVLATALGVSTEELRDPDLEMPAEQPPPPRGRPRKQPPPAPAPKAKRRRGNK